MFKPSDLIRRQLHGTAAMLGALPRTPATLGAVVQLAALGRPPLAAGGLLRWALAVPAERLGAIGALIAHHSVPQNTAAPTITELAAQFRVAADLSTRSDQPTLH
jgi:hypothetical protein